jgi:hypothetical protein
VVLAEHPLATEKGQLIKNSYHSRDYSKPLDTIPRALLDKLASTERAQASLEHIRCLKGRYQRDQFQAIEKAVKGLEDSSVNDEHRKAVSGETSRMI